MEVLYLFFATVRQPSRPHVLTERTRGKECWSEDLWYFCNRIPLRLLEHGYETVAIS